MATPKRRVYDGRVTLDRESMRSAREAKGLTQYDIADAMGVRMQSVWRWEHGQQRPLRDQAQAIAELLDVELADIVKGDTGLLDHPPTVPPESAAGEVRS